MVLLLAFVAGCGAKTGLTISEPEPADAAVTMDAPVDAPVDAPPLVDVRPPTCTVFGATAELLPLDVFMLFDASGSMQENTPTGVTKWLAVRRAIARFVRDPDSRGIGVALSFYPLVQTDVPTLCDADATCGRGGPCLAASGCLEAGVLCNTQMDCAVRGFPSDPCIPLGFCAAGGVEELCVPDGSFPCAPGRGPCRTLGICEGRDNCDPDAYSRPAVGPEVLPEAAATLLRTYDRFERPRDDAGGTNTLPALTGVVDGAIRWSRENPTHKVVVVLATDGFPTSCDPDLRVSLDLGVSNVADQAARGLAEASIETFVIGVFGPDERAFAQRNLDRIADAGGTTTAFVVNTASGVTDEFRDALNRVRLDSTACDFALSEPIPITGDPVWARILRPSGEEIWVPEVRGPEDCTGGPGFYFPDPSDGFASRIALCPSSCAVLGASPDREIEVFTVCTDDPTEP
jgi:hypothetical protein